MARLALLPLVLKGDSSKSLQLLRAIQASCSLVVCIFVVVLAATSYNGYGSALLISAVWGAGVMGVLSIISILLIKRPVEIWPLACTLDAGATFCGVVNIVCLGIACVYNIVCIVPLFATLVSSSAFIITGYRTFSLHCDRFNHTRPSDPLQPYLIKKEIDVWCYPVQLDGARASKQYAMELFDLEQGSTFTKPQHAPSAEANIVAPPARDIPQSTAMSQMPTAADAAPSVAETTAAWSVPSGNETYQPSQKAASTVLPSYARPPSINGSEHSSQ